MPALPRGSGGGNTRDRADAGCRNCVSGRAGYNGCMLTIDEFSKVDLRVGTVVDAKLHPNADRLLVLQVDLGGERRQIVAGIRSKYSPEQLLGKQIVVVANLQPAQLRGIESQGMLLAASDEQGELAVITPDRPVSAGARVK